MQATYAPTIDRIIQRYEGGYGWNKKDRGGPTKYGITCYDLAEHRGTTMNSMAEWAPYVSAMTLREAEDIYHVKYAQGLHYDTLSAGVDACMLDYAINSGVSRPIVVACKLLGLPAHHAMTQDLIDAINKATPNWFINAMCQERLAFMHGIRGGSDWQEFGHGWQQRVDDVEQYSKRLADGKVPPNPTPDLSKVSTPKATHTDPHLKKKAGAVVATTAPTGSAGAHVAGAPPVVVALIFAAIVVGVCVWYLWQQRRNDKANATVVLPLTIPPQPVMHVQV